jgi:disulfide bond formation protein DsbB
MASGLIGGFHAGVEYGWWQGITGCATTISGGGASALDNIMNAPLVRCDVAPWTLLGISLAGWNFIISIGAGCAILALLGRKEAA